MLGGVAGNIVTAVTSQAIAGSISTYDEVMSFRFVVDIEGISVPMGFDKVSGIGGEIEVIERRTGQEPNRNRKLPGLTKVSSVTLSHGVTTTDDMFNWFKTAMDLTTLGNLLTSLRRNVRVSEIGVGGIAVKTWLLKQCWPSSYKAGDFDSKSSDVLIEELVLEVEDVILESVASGAIGAGINALGGIGGGVI